MDNYAIWSQYTKYTLYFKTEKHSKILLSSESLDNGVWKCALICSFINFTSVLSYSILILASYSLNAVFWAGAGGEEMCHFPSTNKNYQLHLPHPYHFLKL